MDPLSVILIIMLAAIAVGLMLSVQRVPPNHTYTIDRLGNFHRTLGPGLHVIVPFLDRITHKVSMMGRVLDIHCQCMQTKDQHAVAADGMLFFQVLDPRKVAGRLNTLDEAAQSLTTTTTAEMVQQMTYNSLNRRSDQEINAWLLGLLNQSAGQWGVRITRIELDFSEQADIEEQVHTPGQ